MCHISFEDFCGADPACPSGHPGSAQVPTAVYYFTLLFTRGAATVSQDKSLLTQSAPTLRRGTPGSCKTRAYAHSGPSRGNGSPLPPPPLCHKRARASRSACGLTPWRRRELLRAPRAGCKTSFRLSGFATGSSIEVAPMSLRAIRPPLSTLGVALSGGEVEPM